MRSALWPELTAAENDRDADVILNAPSRYAVFVAESNAGGLCGFVDASLRDYADGCDSSPVGYLEGWFVEPRARGAGVGRQLVEAAETWARSMGCSEMASDAILENVDSQKAHVRLGYAEVERAVRYRKSLI